MTVAETNKRDGKGIQEEGTKVIRDWKNGCE
jgi:hypothetical protein